MALMCGITAEEASALLSSAEGPRGSIIKTEGVQGLLGSEFKSDSAAKTPKLVLYSPPNAQRWVDNKDNGSNDRNGKSIF